MEQSVSYSWHHLVLPKCFVILAAFRGTNQHQHGQAQCQGPYLRRAHSTKLGALQQQQLQETSGEHCLREGVEFAREVCTGTGLTLSKVQRKHANV